MTELEAQRKDEERQEEEEVTEEPKRFMIQEMARGFSLFEEALLVFETQDLKVEQYMKVTAAVQNAIPCYHVIYDEKKKATIQTSLDCFFKWVGRIESSKEPEPVSSMSGMNKIAACPSSPIADDPSALPSPTSSPSSSQQLFLPVHSMPAPVCQPSYCTTVLFKVLYCKMKNVFFIFCVCLFFMYYLCERYYKPLTVW